MRWDRLKRDVLICGVIGGVLIAALKAAEYQFLVIEHSWEIYGGLTAAIFAGVGIWLGMKIRERHHPPAVDRLRSPLADAPSLPVLAASPDSSAAFPPEPSPFTPEAAAGFPPAPSFSPALDFSPNDQRRESLGITRRELEILEQIALGLSNREIAGKLHVSENTVKTHSSRVFEKLGARRRTQAVQLGKEQGLLP